MRRFSALCTLLFFFSLSIRAQDYLGKEFSIGFSPFYYFERVNSDIVGPIMFQEFFGNLDFNVRLSKRWSTGVRSQLIYFNKKIAPTYSDLSTVNGLYSQFIVHGSGLYRINMELSYSYGNYCSCLPSSNLYGDRLFYLGFGGEIEFIVFEKYENWWFQFGIQTYHINGYYESINSKMPFKLPSLIGQWTIPSIGIQYKFGNTPTFFKWDQSDPK